MNAERFQQIEELFYEVRQIEASGRASFLEDHCRDDLELRAEVESLLTHANGGTVNMHFSSGIDVGKGDSAPTIVNRGILSEGPGTRIGPYKILQKIGEGGFGAVYMADQVEPVQRRVALKIIKLGMDTKQVIARFEAERQALALMDHPNIARVLDAGATDTGRPYFVMELVKGISITEYCDNMKLSTRARLELFIQVCHAIQHAHQKGIIHRDIKPSNVLVTLHDARPVPKVIDFGIAKATSRRLTEKTLFTEFRQLIGTPEYMSPDQAEISGLDVDTRSDIYSLGVLLYELLTGTTPFDADTLRSASYGEIQRIIREVEPPKPSTRMETLATSGSGESISRFRDAEPGTLGRLMRGDLDWIVMKAMEKDRTRRYQSTSELTSDIERHLKGEPVLAGPPSVLYKSRKFVRRHRLGVAAGLFITASLVVGLSVATFGLVEARQEARRSQRIADFLQDLFITTNPEEALNQEMDVEGVLATARELFGEDHATVAATLSSRALQLQSSGELEAAERMYQESLALWRKQYGEDNINVGTTLNRLGVMLMTKGDVPGAEQAFRESLDITRALPEGDTLAASETMAQLAQVLVNRGEFGEAEGLMRESIRIRKALAPRQYLQIALLNHILANMLSLAGNDAGLGELVNETVRAWRAALPADSVLLARILTEYGMFRYRHEELELAEAYLREALDIFHGSNSPGLQHRYMAVRVLCSILGDRNEFMAALPIAREGVELAPEIEGGRNLTKGVRLLAGIAWRIAMEPDLDAVDYEAAREAVERCLKEMPDEGAYLNTLGVLRYRLGLYQEALETFALSHAFYTQTYDEGVPADLAFMAMAHFRLGQEAKAQEIMATLRRIMKDSQNALSEDNQKHLAEAEALLRGDGEASLEKND